MERTADLLRVQFGDRRHLAGGDGGTDVREVGTYALHVACPWRLTEATYILVGSGDLLTPADPDAEIESFDWDEPGASWLDVRLSELAERYASRPPTVETVAGDIFGGVRLALSNDLVVEIFPNSTPTGHVATEFWRLLQPGVDTPHFTVGTFGIERE